MSNRTLRTTLEQGRAAFAFACAQVAKKDLGSKAKEYKAYAKKMPMLIKTNGLGAALAFAFSKGNKNGKPDTSKSWGLLYAHIEEWIRKDEKQVLPLGNEPLVKAIIHQDSAQYRAATIEVLAFLAWLRRFADGLIEGEGGD
ncbi:type III-B CRISPR module-associated protein Cmr5 [Microscilla marina]|uniref:CRISPR type III-B/RAMP module-associated protein Cmr5 n=1 Tax=Microscilla marina ATCC 23134 TaxID=313606 RepID=A1ZP51_MICM2|nr:type III-B CRISPR module-associated protein Cmr5 [Microscilla marina]EAY27843.1 crispr-associated protein, Cmr5 family [Microscilla marina ATCC 23134]